MKKITVAALGPGPREYLTLGTIEELKKAKKIILRTKERCDAANYLAEIGLSFETLDFLHEECEDFDELNRRAADFLMEQAEKTEICYGVFDPSRDETVAALRDRGAVVSALPGVPLSAPFLAAAAPKGDTIEIQTASSLKITSAQNPLLILECDSRILMGNCKLQLLDWYDMDQPVLFFPPGDDPARRFITCPLSDLDRQIRYDHTCAALILPLGLMEKKRFDFYDLVRVMGILRGENGCPWDREQTHETLRKYLIEEAYETAAAIDEEDWDHVADVPHLPKNDRPPPAHFRGRPLRNGAGRAGQLGEDQKGGAGLHHPNPGAQRSIQGASAHGAGFQGAEKSGGRGL